MTTLGHHIAGERLGVPLIFVPWIAFVLFVPGYYGF